LVHPDSNFNSLPFYRVLDKEEEMTIDIDDVGLCFVDGHGEIWRCVSYCQYPSVTFEKVYGRKKQRLTFAVESPLANQMKRLDIPMKRVRITEPDVDSNYENWRSNIGPEEK
jgi:hypothetical protein